MSTDDDFSIESEVERAIDALVYRLQHRDPDTDDRAFAVEYVTALRGQGWRPTPARPAPAWRDAVARPGVAPNAAFRAQLQHLSRRRAGNHCEVCCPAPSCGRPYTDPVCRCTTHCGADECRGDQP